MSEVQLGSPTEGPKPFANRDEYVAARADAEVNVRGRTAFEARLSATDSRTLDGWYREIAAGRAVKPAPGEAVTR